MESNRVVRFRCLVRMVIAINKAGNLWIDSAGSYPMGRTAPFLEFCPQNSSFTRHEVWEVWPLL
jgi:hypothetical protein